MSATGAECRAWLWLQSWAGLVSHPVEVVGETPKRLRVRWLGDTTLSGRFQRGGVYLVPRDAVRERPVERQP